MGSSMFVVVPALFRYADHCFSIAVNVASRSVSVKDAVVSADCPFPSSRQRSVLLESPPGDRRRARPVRGCELNRGRENRSFTAAGVVTGFGRLDSSVDHAIRCGSGSPEDALSPTAMVSSRSFASTVW